MEKLFPDVSNEISTLHKLFSKDLSDIFQVNIIIVFCLHLKKKRLKKKLTMNMSVIYSLPCVLSIVDCHQKYVIIHVVIHVKVITFQKKSVGLRHRKNWKLRQKYLFLNDDVIKNNANVIVLIMQLILVTNVTIVKVQRCVASSLKKACLV